MVLLSSSFRLRMELKILWKSPTDASLWEETISKFWLAIWFKR